MRYLRIPKRSRGKGEYVYCSRCKVCVNTTCKKTNKRISTCQYPNSHSFKAIYIVPKTGGLRISKQFSTRNYNEFKKQALNFFERLRKLHITKANYQEIIYLLEEKTQLEKDIKRFISFLKIKSKLSPPPTLFYSKAVLMYLNFMAGINVAKHKRKVRSKEYLQQLKLYFNYFSEVLKRLGHDPDFMPLDTIGEKEVEALHFYYESKLKENREKKYGAHSYNKGMGAIKKLFQYFIKEKRYDMPNPFRGLIKKYIPRKEVSIIKSKEFEQLLNVTTAENGFKLKKDRTRQYRENLYRDWMRNAFRLGLETGERRDGIVHMTWDNIDMPERIIRVRNHKLSNMRKREIIRMLPITESLYDLLIEMGYEAHKDSKDYLIATEYKNRKTAMDLISAAFRHFWQLTGIKGKEDVSFRHLRKTYATLMMKQFGDNASRITGQSIDTIIKHYLDNKSVIKLAKNINLQQIEQNLTYHRSFYPPN